MHLKGLLRREGILVAPGVYDGLSSRIVEQHGFEAAYLSGGAVARGAGVPDLGLLTLSETAARLAQVVDAVSVPVIADADTGYGNPLSVRRTVTEFERAGASALHLEDQITPKRCGHYQRKELIGCDQMTAKVQAALDARSDPNLLVIARTDAIAAEGLDAAIERARAYVRAGAELLFVEAPTSEAEIARIATEVNHPLVINMFAGGKTPLLPADRLAAYGYKLMIVPSDLQRAATQAMADAAEILRRDGSTERYADRMASFSSRDTLVGLEQYEALEARYVRGPIVDDRSNQTAS